MDYVDVHDNIIESYEVNIKCETLTLHMITEKTKHVDIIFKGTSAHLFNNVQKWNIIFDIEELNFKEFSENYGEEIPKWLRFGFPIMAKDSYELEVILSEGQYKIYDISSSMGLSGFVIAKGVELIAPTTTERAQSEI